MGTWWRPYNAHKGILSNGQRRTLWILKLEGCRSALDSSTPNGVSPSPWRMHVQLGKACLKKEIAIALCLVSYLKYHSRSCER